MNIIPRRKNEERNELASLRNRLDSVLGNFFDLAPLFRNDWELEPIMQKEWGLPLDIKETEKEIIVKADVPGVESKDIDINLKEGVLTIKGEKKEEKEEKDEKDGNRYYMERRYGCFSRSVSLGSEVDRENIKADLKDGVLTVTLLKKEDEKKKEIKIEVKK